jgi:tetratricopeptide (TPR) repeat protein
MPGTERDRPERRPSSGGAGGRTGRDAPAIGSRSEGAEARGRAGGSRVGGKGRPSGAPDRGRGGRPGSDEERSGPPRVSAPQLFDDAQVELLDRRVRDALAILGPELALRVGRHLSAAGLLLDDDPQEALAHARYARQRAARLAEVREALGVAAYVAGDYALARSELRTVRRMTGLPGVLPLLADCERALGRPQEAIELGRAEGFDRLDRDDQLELLMVVAGARLDLGEPAQALRTLAVPELHLSDEAAADRGAVLRLWYVQAEVLLAAERPDEARDWFDRVASLGEDLTDAAERADALRSG